MFDDLFKPDVVFKYGGRGPKEFDCFGLAIEIRNRLGIETPDFQTPDSEIGRNKLISKETNSFIKLEKPQPFCLVAISLYDRKYVDHVGVVWKNNYQFIHISENTRVSLERLDDIFLWKHKIRGFYK